MTTPEPASQAEHNRQTREACGRLAAVWPARWLPIFIVYRLRHHQQGA